MKRKKFDYSISYVVFGRPYYFPTRKDALIYAKHYKLPSSSVYVCCEIIEDGYFFAAHGFASNIKQAKINALLSYDLRK